MLTTTKAPATTIGAETFAKLLKEKGPSATKDEYTVLRQRLELFAYPHVPGFALQPPSIGRTIMRSMRHHVIRVLALSDETIGAAAWNMLWKLFLAVELTSEEKRPLLFKQLDMYAAWADEFTHYR